MSEPLLARTAPAPSRLRRHILQLAAVLTLVTGVLLSFAAASAPDVTRLPFAALLAGLVVALAVSTLLLRQAHAKATAVEVSVDADGTIMSLAAPATAAQPPAVVRVTLVPVALTPLTLMLRGDGQRVVVWRDSLPPEAFRRLVAVARWRIDRRPRAQRAGPA